MVWIPGGTFRMGSDAFYPEERPVRRVAVDGFWIDRHQVTNERFARFVDATRYLTDGTGQRRAWEESRGAVEENAKSTPTPARVSAVV